MKMDGDEVLREDSGTAAVDRAITSRRSVRHFRDVSVPRAVLTEILDVAARAPSGNNVQPWSVHVLMGGARRRISDAILAEFTDPGRARGHEAEYQFYPSEWIAPYKDRRKKVGLDMYSLLGIAKGNVVRMQEQLGKNYDFFGAPVGLIFTIDRSMVQGTYLDYGMFMQNIMTAARARGIDTCPQAAFAIYHRVLREHLEISPGHIVICGMALGYGDPEGPLDALATHREPSSAFARFYD